MYKRQMVRCLDSALGNEIEKYTLVFVDDIPVSYTHLDVYKRQHTHNRSALNIGLTPTTQRVECGRQKKERSSER